MVLGGHSTASTQSLGQHGGRARSSVYSVPCNVIFSQDWTKLVLLQSVVARSRAGLGLSACESSVRFTDLWKQLLLINLGEVKESFVAEDVNEEQDYYLLPAGQMKNISFYIWLFLIFFFFSLFEIFALLFFSSQILPPSL